MRDRRVGATDFASKPTLFGVNVDANLFEASGEGVNRAGVITASFHARTPDSIGWCAEFLERSVSYP
jgi:hypothetical protein